MDKRPFELLTLERYYEFIYSSMHLHKKFDSIRTICETLYGSIQLCKDKSSKTHIAAKVSNLSLASQYETKNGIKVYENVRQELKSHRILSSTLHPHENILQLYESFIEDDNLVMIMEYANQGDLYQIISDESLTPQQSRDYAYQIAKGIQFMHQINIAHRDISLENILVSNGVCKICDFGLSCPADSLQDKAVGKPMYIAPEVVEHEGEYDPRQADVWSYGCVLFILSTGMPLLEYPTLKDPRFQLLSTDGISEILRRWNMYDNLSISLIELLEKIFILDPCQRITFDKILQHPYFQQ